MSQSYRQLRLDERETIFRMKDSRLPVSRIAEQLGRHPSTIYRELRRNFFYDEDSYFRCYFPSVAHKLASDRRDAICGTSFKRVTTRRTVLDRSDQSHVNLATHHCKAISGRVKSRARSRATASFVT
jgi:IS30 family transposase